MPKIHLSILHFRRRIIVKKILWKLGRSIVFVTLSLIEVVRKQVRKKKAEGDWHGELKGGKRERETETQLFN